MIQLPDGYTIIKETVQTAAQSLGKGQVGWTCRIDWSTPQGNKFTFTKNQDIKHFRTDLFYQESLRIIMDFVRKGSH